MRKRLKLKKKSCCLCKPHKMRGACRWSAKELARLKDDEKACLDAVKKNTDG